MHGIAGMKGPRYWGLGSGWKAMRNLSEMTSARPSSSAKGLIPEESCIVWREKGSRFSSLFLSSFFFFSLLSSAATLARDSREGNPESARAVPLPMMTSDSDLLYQGSRYTEDEWIINWFRRMNRGREFVSQEDSFRIFYLSLFSFTIVFQSWLAACKSARVWKLFVRCMEHFETSFYFCTTDIEKYLNSHNW